MKTTCKIQVFDDDVGQECFSELVRLCSESIHNGVLRLAVPPDHPIIPKVISVLEAHELKMPPNAKTPSGKEFIDIEYLRKFDDEDLAAAKYLQIAAEESVSNFYNRTSSGVLQIKTGYHNKRFRVASVFGKIVVHDTVREEFKNQKFKHLLLRRCEVYGGGAEKHENFPIWEVTSDLVLPPLSPKCKFCDCYGGSEYTDPTKGCTIDDGLYVPTQHRYRESDLSSVEPFDTAHTREAFGFGLASHRLIVSQRFYQFCKKQKFKMWWYPVVLDP